MSDTPFVHLHCHTDYSLLDGACEISQLMDLVQEQKVPAIAMTDHGNLFGAVEFYNEAKERGIHPILGCELYVSQQGHKTRSDSDRYNHLVLLAENQEGYRNLIKLVSTGYLDGFYYKPRVDKDLLAQHSKGLICLSACLRGDVNEALMADEYGKARQLAASYEDMFGKGNFFLELQDHNLDPDRKVIPGVVQLARDLGIPLVATNDSHYMRHSDARAHEIMLCIQTGKTMSDPNRMRFTTEEFHIKTKAEMEKLFGDHPQALDVTWEIAQRCKVKLEKVKDPFPRFEVPSEHSLDSYFEWVARHGFEKRIAQIERKRSLGQPMKALEEYRERLNREILCIQQMKFSGYFLIVWDFIRYAKTHNCPVGPGRGSAAGSLVSYAMEITDIDPLEYGLLFERFLNPERISMPDIDVDFHTRGRSDVIRYVTEKYGREQVAQIITFGTLGAKAAIKDVARALDIPYKDVEPITKLVPAVLNIKLKQAFEMEPGFADLKRKDPRAKEVLEVAQRLEGMARNASIHAAGVVISPEPLKELVPLYKTNKDEIVTQYDGVGLEKLALLKMDFLGLTTLDIIDDAIKLVDRHRGVKIVPEELPLDDLKTYELFSRGLTGGVFQFESGGMKDILRRSQPSRIDDLIALNALYRPGPIQGGMIDDFIDRKHGKKEIAYDLPQLEEVLQETYGVIVYQEQVMRIANLLGGYSLGEADLLRRAMGKKKKEEMEAQRERFLEGARRKRINEKKAGKIFDLMEQFAGYGFNKSHSAAYAYLAYITGYLKAHYPLEFLSALLTSETGNSAKLGRALQECREMQIRILAPDVNESDHNFTPVGSREWQAGSKTFGIRFGLCAIKNVGAHAVDSIIAARKQGGRFKSLFNFVERVDLGAVNKRMMEALIRSGAMDSLGARRSQLLAAIDEAIETAQRRQRDRDSGQTDLFGVLLGAEEEPADPPLPPLPEMAQEDLLRGEREMLGFYVTGHPLDAYIDKLQELATHNSTNLEGLEKGTEVKLCGLISSIQRRRNKENKPWAVVQLDDLDGTVECLVFASQYDNLQQFLQENTAVYIKGIALPEESNPTKINVQDLIPLDKVRLDYPTLVAVRVFLGRDADGTRQAMALQDLFQRKQGATHVRLKLEQPRDFQILLDIPATIKPDREFISEVRRICGADAYEKIG